MKIVFVLHLHEKSINSRKGKTRITPNPCCTFHLIQCSCKNVLFKISGQQCSNTNPLLRAGALGSVDNNGLVMCHLLNMPTRTHHCADVMFKVNDRYRGPHIAALRHTPSLPLSSLLVLCLFRQVQPSNDASLFCRKLFSSGYMFLFHVVALHPVYHRSTLSPMSSCPSAF